MFVCAVRRLSSAPACRRLPGRVSVVTGGAHGIGRAIVTRLASEGSAVAFCDVDAVEGAVVRDELVSQGHSVQFFDANVADETSVIKFVGAAEAWGGRLDILVNNAAAFVFGKVEDLTEKSWMDVLNVNVKGYSWMMKHTIPVMRRGGRGGAIVNLASISSTRGQAGMVPYNASKGAILQMTKCAALDHGSENIRVNAVSPGPILTRATLRHAKSQNLTTEDLVKGMVSHLVLPRMGTPDEVAAAVAFLASDDASFVSGAELAVDGGYLAV